MEIVEIKKAAFVFDSTEREKLIQCLKYCRHRLKEHKDCGLQKSDVGGDFIRYILSGLGVYYHENEKGE